MNHPLKMLLSPAITQHSYWSRASYTIVFRTLSLKNVSSSGVLFAKYCTSEISVSISCPFTVPDGCSSENVCVLLIS